MKGITYAPIGIIHTPFTEPRNTPIQPAGARGIKGTIVIFPDYAEGLKDLEGFSHIILLFHCHLVKSYSPQLKPFLDDHLRGVFATRAPSRPNPIGLSIVRLVKLEKNTIFIQDVDIVDGTPLLDIKPYFPESFNLNEVKVGWLGGKLHYFSKTKDNSRFMR
ncbi:MAG: tRNA (N6-threonylcarbamoyladenosine(37)-N6)-methyltransferase TrmO [Promethearchaeota archaeon]